MVNGKWSMVNLNLNLDRSVLLGEVECSGCVEYSRLVGFPRRIRFEDQIVMTGLASSRLFRYLSGFSRSEEWGGECGYASH